MPSGVQQPAKIETPSTGFLGLDTASEPTSINVARSRRLLNAYQGKIKALTKRPGSLPVHSNAVDPIKHIMFNPFTNKAKVGVAPTLRGVYNASSTLTAGTYYVRYTYLTTEGETDASPEASIVINPAAADPTTAPGVTQLTFDSHAQAASQQSSVNSFGSTYHYNDGVYSGDLPTSGSSFVASGSFTSSDSFSTTSSLTCTVVQNWIWTGTGWGSTGVTNNAPSTVFYNSGGYSGTLTRLSLSYANVLPSFTGSVAGQPASTTTSGFVVYSGTVSRPASDTRIYQQNYSGTVTKPLTSSLPTGTYYVGYTWKTAVGETVLSSLTTVTVSTSNVSLSITLPAIPALVTAAKIYIGTSSGTLYLQTETAITSYSQTVPIATDVLAPTVNSTKPALRVALPSYPLHVTGAKVYISTTTNLEKLQGSSIISTTFDQSSPISTGTAAYPIKNTATVAAELLVAAGSAVYTLGLNSLLPVTMTNTLKTASVYDVNFTNSLLSSLKVIADGGNLKGYDGNVVKDVVAKANDSSPAPENVLTDINAKGCKYIWTHNDHLFISPGTNEIFYTKRYEFDYVPETQFFLLVKDGDYVNGCGIPFDDVCFVPLRRSWNVITGTNFDDFDSSNYLNTINGVIAPRSISKITYATGYQTVAYLSDDGVNEIYMVSIDNKGRQYATKNLMNDKIDFGAFGFTDEEKALAISKYIGKYSMYLLEISRAGTPYVFGFDTRNQEWYLWTGLQINAFFEHEGVVYFGGDDGSLKRFDSDLCSDWTDINKTIGVPVDFDRLSGVIALEETGYPSTLDYYILMLKTYAVKASLDISIVHLRGLVEVQEVIKNAYLVWDVSEWDNSVWANLDYSDLVAAPQRLSNKLNLPKKGFYFQFRWRNNRDEPCEVYGESLVGRTSGEL